MKNLLLTLLCLPLFADSQTTENKNRFGSFDGLYQWTHSGENLNFNYNFHSKKHFVTTGLVVHVNTMITDNRNYAFQHRAYHRTQAQRIGLNVGYCKMIKINSDGVHPYYFFNEQVQHIGFREEFPVPTGDTIYNFGDLETRYRFIDPVYHFETTMGFGMIINLFKGFSIQQSVGVGITSMAGNFVDELWSEYNFPKHFQVMNEGCLSLRLGINYSPQFSKQK